MKNFKVLALLLAVLISVSASLAVSAQARQYNKYYSGQSRTGQLFIHYEHDVDSQKDEYTFTVPAPFKFDLNSASFKSIVAGLEKKYNISVTTKKPFNVLTVKNTADSKRWYWEDIEEVLNPYFKGILVASYSGLTHQSSGPWQITKSSLRMNLKNGQDYIEVDLLPQGDGSSMDPLHVRITYRKAIQPDEGIFDIVVQSFDLSMQSRKVVMRDLQWTKARPMCGTPNPSSTHPDLWNLYVKKYVVDMYDNTIGARYGRYFSSNVVSKQLAIESQLAFVYKVPEKQGC